MKANVKMTEIRNGPFDKRVLLKSLEHYCDKNPYWVNFQIQDGGLNWWISAKVYGLVYLDDLGYDFEIKCKCSMDLVEHSDQHDAVIHFNISGQTGWMKEEE